MLRSSAVILLCPLVFMPQVATLYVSASLLPSGELGKMLSYSSVFCFGSIPLRDNYLTRGCSSLMVFSFLSTFFKLPLWGEGEISFAYLPLVL